MGRCVVIALLLVGCAGPPPPALTSTVTIGSTRFQVDVADSPAERARGLMGQTSLAPGTGMLFRFDDVATRSFWMKDTLIALDLISIRAGRVAAIQRLEPCRADPCPTTETPEADSVLEVAAGAAGDLVVGEQVTISP